jgi:hypothetical protein
MKKVGFLILMLIIGFATIAKEKKHKKKRQAGSEIESINIHRTPCYGRCPTYIINIEKNGLVTYNAIMFNEDSGIFKKNIGAKNAIEILSQVTIKRLDTCRDEYPMIATDLPGLIVTIKWPTKTKTIHNANHGPYVLKNLVERIDAVVGKKVDGTWKKE